jgi:hypothetical protein
MLRKKVGKIQGIANHIAETVSPEQSQGRGCQFHDQPRSGFPHVQKQKEVHFHKGASEIGADSRQGPEGAPCLNRWF